MTAKNQQEAELWSNLYKVTNSHIKQADAGKFRSKLGLLMVCQHKIIEQNIYF